MPDNTPKAIQDCHALLHWIIPQLDKFPRQRRYTLGERIEVELLNVMEALLEARFNRNKGAILARANLKLDLARHLWRLSYPLANVQSKSFEHGARLMVILGQQIGAWRKSRG